MDVLSLPRIQKILLTGTKKTVLFLSATGHEPIDPIRNRSCARSSSSSHIIPFAVFGLFCCLTNTSRKREREKKKKKKKRLLGNRKIHQKYGTSESSVAFRVRLTIVSFQWDTHSIPYLQCVFKHFILTY
jgi:hypothetical protein